MEYGWTCLLFFLMKHNMLSKYPRRGTCMSFYEVIDLFIRLQNLLFMLLISKLKGLYLISFWSCIFFVSCCRTWGSDTLQQCLLNFFAFGCWLEDTLIHALFIDVNIVFLRVFWPIHGLPRCGETTHLITWAQFFQLQKAFTVLAVFFLYSRALHTSLARVHGFSFMVTTHDLTALKKNEITENIFVKF